MHMALLARSLAFSVFTLALTSSMAASAEETFCSTLEAQMSFDAPHLNIGDAGLVASNGVVWRGANGDLSLKALAERLAPILWFSPDEPLLHSARSIPDKLPCDPDAASGPVVYFSARQARRLLADPADVVDVTDGGRVTVTFHFYYPEDIGAGCHSNDLEHATFDIRFRRSPMSTDDHAAILFTAVLEFVEGAAHGSTLFSNNLLLARGMTSAKTSLPIVLLVEEGKHAVCPDRNGDGVITPGYDVNEAIGSAWGVRDIFGSGYAGGARYQPWMTKPRFPEDRLRPEVADLMMWRFSYRAPWPLPSRTYSLRPVPVQCRLSSSTNWPEPKPLPGCTHLSLASLLADEGLRTLRPSEAVKQWTLRYLSGVRLRVEASSYGVSSALPFAQEFLSGGVLGVNVTARLVQMAARSSHHVASGGGDFEAYYTPSMSTFIDWYVRAGYGLDAVEPHPFHGSVVEAGIELRWLPHVVVAAGAARRGGSWNAVFEAGLPVVLHH
jgi:hypothetical protein